MKFRWVQALKLDDLTVRFEFCRYILARTADNDFTAKFIFSVEPTFHINGTVNLHNIQVWGTENPHVTLEHERDSLKVNVFFAISKVNIYGRRFFVGKNIYLQLLT
jgi:hypothetical protein